MGRAPLLGFNLVCLVLNVALVKTAQLSIAVEHHAESTGRAGTSEDEERGGGGAEGSVFDGLAAETQVAEHTLSSAKHGESGGERFTVGLSNL